MQHPFVFGIPVEGENFTDRKEETKRLANNFTYGINTFIISPRRWGKTSLVRKAAASISTRDTKVVYLDIFSCRNEYDFYDKFLTAVIKQTSSKLEEWIDNARRILSHLAPKFSFGSDPINDFTISLDVRNTKDSPDEILQLPEKIAEEKGVRIVICIDEFQQIGEFPDSLRFQRQLRSHWQLQGHVSYCLFGSKRHLMQSLFDLSSKPFYKFGDIMHLDKIPAKDWSEFIIERFENTGKSISAELAYEICDLVDRNSSYVQQLAWTVWAGTKDKASASDLSLAFDMLLNQNGPLFDKQIESLSGYQLNYLRAMINGISKSFTSKAVIDKFDLGSSSNVIIIQKALEKREIIYIEHQTSTFCDPLMPHWLKRHL